MVHALAAILTFIAVLAIPAGFTLALFTNEISWLILSAASLGFLLYMVGFYE